MLVPLVYSVPTGVAVNTIPMTVMYLPIMVVEIADMELMVAGRYGVFRWTPPWFTGPWIWPVRDEIVRGTAGVHGIRVFGPNLFGLWYMEAVGEGDLRDWYEDFTQNRFTMRYEANRLVV